MSSAKANCSRPLKSAGNTSSNSKHSRKVFAKHLLLKDRSEQDRFQQLRAEKKRFLDAIKFIAYRAETALAQLAREKMHRLDAARSLIRQLFRTQVDLIPDQ